eukprot:1390872-Amorphochlora_amoeboformis.AAC.1
MDALGKIRLHYLRICANIKLGPDHHAINGTGDWLVKPEEEKEESRFYYSISRFYYSNRMRVEITITVLV